MKENADHEKVKPLTPVTELLETVGVLSFSNNKASVGCLDSWCMALSGKPQLSSGPFWSARHFSAELAYRELETDLRSISSPTWGASGLRFRADRLLICLPPGTCYMLSEPQIFHTMGTQLLPFPAPHSFPLLPHSYIRTLYPYTLVSHCRLPCLSRVDPSPGFFFLGNRRDLRTSLASSAWEAKRNEQQWMFPTSQRWFVVPYWHPFMLIAQSLEKEMFAMEGPERTRPKEMMAKPGFRPMRIRL